MGPLRLAAIRGLAGKLINGFVMGLAYDYLHVAWAFPNQRREELNEKKNMNMVLL